MRGFDFNDNRIIWLTTALAVAVILGLAVIVSLQKAPLQEGGTVVTAPPPAARQQPKQAEKPVAAASRPAVRQAPDKDKKAQLEAPRTLSVAPVAGGRQESGADLVLDRLAGTLGISGFGDGKTVAPGKILPLKYTCFRESVTPPLAWQGAPKGTKSFALFLEKREKEEVLLENWLLFNIPGDAAALRGNLPRAGDPGGGMSYAGNGYGNAGYNAPCDRKGRHSYVFRLFALDASLPLKQGAGRDDLVRAMNGHILDAAELPVVHLYKP